MIQQELIDKFGGIINHMSCIYLRDGERHLRSFLEELKPMDTIIEIGTYQGVSACVLADYAKRVFTYDIKNINSDLKNEIVNFLNAQNVYCFIGKPKEIEIQIQRVFKKEKVDLCFIDGEHFGGELEKDFDMCKECNRIIIHDYATSFREVFDFVNSLKGWKKDIRDTFVLLTKESKFTENKIIKKQIKNIEKPVKKKRGRPKSTKK